MLRQKWGWAPFQRSNYEEKRTNNLSILYVCIKCEIWSIQFTLVLYDSYVLNIWWHKCFFLWDLGPRGSSEVRTWCCKALVSNMDEPVFRKRFVASTVYLENLLFSGQNCAPLSSGLVPGPESFGHDRQFLFRTPAMQSQYHHCSLDQTCFARPCHFDLGV